MMSVANIRPILLATAFALAGCGGGAGSNLASTPPPPPPPATAPLFAQPVAATESLEFNVVGGDLRIRFDNNSKTYEVMLPGQDWAKVSYNGNNYVLDGSGRIINFAGRDVYSYTGIVTTVASNLGNSVAYGIATPLSGVPVTGSASYTAQVFGGAAGYSFTGTAAHFDFDFASGTLAGYINASVETFNSQNFYDLGRYDFAQTVFSGGQSFSGNLSHDGTTDGSFNGVFTGPQAQELMGQLQLPFRDPVAPDTILNASGLFIGKIDP